MRIGVYGNLTLDELDRNGKHLVRPGGSALYSSLAADYLGAKVSVFSNTGVDYPRNVLPAIANRGIDVSGVKKLDGPTTRFRISYRGNSRKLEIVHPGQNIKPSETPRIFDAIHLGPVYLEIGLDTLNYARRHARFLSIDIQGLLRSEGPKRIVGLKNRRIDSFLSKCDLVKATEEEAHVIARTSSLISTARRLLQKGGQYALITRGRSGSLLAQKNGKAIHVPSVPEIKLVDPTGAGDVFIGSWLATFLAVKDVSWAGAVGAAFASLSIRGFGASKFRFSRRELFRRASWVYNHSSLIKD